MVQWLWIGIVVALAVLAYELHVRRRHARAAVAPPRNATKTSAKTKTVAKAKSAAKTKSSAKMKSAAKTKTRATDDVSARSVESAIPNVLPRLEFEEDVGLDPTRVGAASLVKHVAAPIEIVYDEDAATDEPTRPHALILVTAKAQTDCGLRRKRNEDSVLVLEDEHVFVVADGMGGYRGGEVASHLAVETIQDTFRERRFEPPADTMLRLPRRAWELASAIQRANLAILEKAEGERQLTGMGTTVCAARFTLEKPRLYLGHVGDSRVYRMRNGALERMTSDHTMKDLGVTGEASVHLSRAVGIWPVVPIDVILGKPAAGDYYLLCSDGLTKMVNDGAIEQIFATSREPGAIVEKLVGAANASGGLDNISVIVVRVDEPPLLDAAS